MSKVNIAGVEIDLDSPKVKEAKNIEELRKLNLFPDIPKGNVTPLLDALWKAKKGESGEAPEED